ncbi:MAG: NosD domain-containing protein [Methanothrix sp.]|nr:NosD domain-containing protein [Methanothrix sp.]
MADLASSGQISKPTNTTIQGTIIHIQDSIQQEIDAAEPGDLLIVESGVYFNGINITKSISLIGRDTGFGPPVIDAGGNGSAVTLSADGISLEGFRIINSSGTEGNAGLKVISNKNIIKNNNISQNNGTGISLSDSQENEIINNTIIENDLHGISLSSSSSHNKILKNEVCKNNASGIGLWNRSNDNLLEGNLVSFNKLGISLWNECDQNQLLENNASQNDFSGIQIYQGMNSTIAKNTAVLNNYSGIAIVSSMKSRIMANNLRWNKYGINMAGTSGDEVSSNLARSNQMQGIKISDSMNLSLKENQMNQNHEALLITGSESIISISNNASFNEVGMAFQDSRLCTIKDNEAFQNGNGMVLMGSSQCILTSNKIHYNRLEGLAIGRSDDNLISENEILSNYDGIYIDNALNNSIKSNRATGNVDHGILLFNNSSHNALVDNNLQKNGWGILVSGSRDNILIDNMAKDNYYGLYFSGSEGNNLSGSILSRNIFNFGDIDFVSPNTVDLTNTIDGKSIYYLVGESEVTIDERSKAAVVYCIDCRNITINGLSISNSSRAIYFRNTTGSNIIGNTIRTSWNGIFLEGSSSNLIEANDVKSTENAIFLESSERNILKSNKAIDNSYGIVLDRSRKNSIATNLAEINYVGLLIANHSEANEAEKNDLEGNGIGIYLNDSYNNLLYQNNASRSEYVGIDLVDSSRNNIKENKASSCWLGIYLKESAENSIHANEIARNQQTGLHFFKSNSNNISRNAVHNNRLDGIMIDGSDINIIWANVVRDNLRAGIRILNSSMNSVEQNKLEKNTWGIYHDNSSHAVMRKNLMVNNRYNFYSRGDNDIDVSNKVKAALMEQNSSIYYLVNDSDKSIEQSSNPGLVYCLNCTNITMKGLNLTNNVYGILLENTTGSRIEGSRLAGNQMGIGLFASNDNNLSNNEILDNAQDGLLIIDSGNNVMERNNISKNKRDGFALANSSGNRVLSNRMDKNINFGIRLNGSRMNSLQSNMVMGNGAGLLLDLSGGNALGENIINNIGSNFNVTGRSYADFDNNISVSNLINDKPIYYLVNASNITLNSTSNAGSVFGLYCTNLSIENLTLRDNYIGIYLRNTTGSKVIGNRFINNTIGISLYGCENNTLEDNTAIDNECGYNIRFSERNFLLHNLANHSTGYGISLQESRQNTLKDNVMENNRYSLSVDRENDIDTSNKVSGSAAFILVNEKDQVLDGSSPAGTIYCFNCRNITIRGQNLSSSSSGIAFYNTTDSLIEDNYLHHNLEGIYLKNSRGNILRENKMIQNNQSGIRLSQSPQNNLEENEAAYNQHGISLFDSRGNTLGSNLLSENRGRGIWLMNSLENNLTNNSAYQNGYGMVLQSSGGSRLISNNLSSNKYNFALLAENRSHMLNSIDPDNLVDGKPIIFLIGSNGAVIDNSDNAGAVYCLDCSNITVKEQEISNSHHGICLYNTSMSRVIGCSFSDCMTGIALIDSESNMVDDNHLKKNGYGIYLEDSISNVISQNQVENSWGDGIKLFESDGNAIWKNKVESGNLSGIYLDPSNRNNVTSNYILNNGQDNVNYGPGSDSNNLRDNQIQAEIGTGGGETNGHSHEVETIDYSSLVEAEKSKLCKGKIAFEPERKMKVGEVYRVEARIAINENVEDLIAGLSSQEKAKVESIPVSTFMKVRLTGPKFDIDPISDERQLVTKSGHQVWLWDVTPQESGTYDLTLSAFAEIILPGQSPMTIDSKVFSTQISVTSKEVPVAEKTQGFFEKNWQFIVGTLIMGSGLLKWILSKIKANAAKGKSQCVDKAEEQKKEDEKKSS